MKQPRRGRLPLLAGIWIEEIKKRGLWEFYFSFAMARTPLIEIMTAAGAANAAMYEVIAAAR